MDQCLYTSITYFFHYISFCPVMLLCTNFKRSWIIIIPYQLQNHYNTSYLKYVHVYRHLFSYGMIDHIISEVSTPVLFFKCLKKIVVKPMKKFLSYACNWKCVSFFCECPVFVWVFCVCPVYVSFYVLYIYISLCECPVYMSMLKKGILSLYI